MTTAGAAAERLGEVVVTAPPVADAVPRADPTAFATVVDTRDAPTRVETLDEALADVVGVQVRRFGGLGDFSTLSVRGFGSGQVQLYLDGVPLSRADNETVNLADLPLDAIDHVEVYRGTTPLAFARSGPGGVVNLVTRRPDAAPVTGASVGWGSFDTRKLDLTRAATAGAWDYLAFAHYFGSTGNFTFRDDNHTPLDPSDDRDVTRRNDGFDGGGFTARVGWRPTPPLALALTSDSFARHQGVPGQDATFAGDTRLDTLRQLVHLDARLDPDARRPFDTDASVWLAYQQQRFVAPLGQDAFTPADTDETTLGAGGQVLVRGAVGTHQVPGLLLAASEEEFGFRDRRARVGREPDRARLRGTVAVEDELLFLGDRVSIVPGVRWEVFRDDFPGTRRTPGALPSPGGVHLQDFVSPRLGVRVDAGHGLTLLGNAGRWVRPPNLQELFGNRGVVKGNPSLRPEKAKNGDIGARWSAPARGPLTAAALEYAFFASDVDDLILLRQNTASVSSPDNVGAARIRGHEVSARARLWRRVGLVANYTHQDARDEGDVPHLRGKQLPQRPADEAFAHVELGWSDALPLPLGAAAARLWPGRVSYEANVVGPNFLNRANTPAERVGSRVYHGVALELALPVCAVRLTLEGKNLGDDRTRDVAGFPLPGRTFYVTLSYGFGLHETP